MIWGVAMAQRGADGHHYQPGFGNEFVSEAVPGALPAGRNSPQRAPLGLYAEQLSGTAFTQPRAVNRRTWVYRIMPSAAHPRFDRIGNGSLRGAPFDEIEPDPNRLRWDPLPLPAGPVDFVDGLYTVGGNGDLRTRSGMAVHLYAATSPMTDRYFVDSDGELLFVPQQGTLVLHTELGPLQLSPGEIAVVPRGIRFRVDLPGGPARGYLCENYGAPFTLPERGPIGANGLANERDFLAPTAAYEERGGPVEVVQKFGGNLWAAPYDHSPLDVVAWHGSYVPVKYDTANFMVLGTVSFDHPDPSIYTVLTSPSAVAGPGQRGLRHLPAALAGRRGHLPAALVPPQRDVGVHGPGRGGLRRQGRGVPARRGQPAQHVHLARPGRRDVRPGQPRGTGPAEGHRHPGVHVREPLDDHPDPAGHGGRAPPARL